MAEENRTLNETTETAEAAAGAADEAAQDMEHGIPAEEIMKEADEAEAEAAAEKKAEEQKQTEDSPGAVRTGGQRASDKGKTVLQEKG